MKATLYLFLLALLFSCKPDPKSSNEKTQSTAEVPELTYIHKLANAHGFENWNNIEEVWFTFVVDKQGETFKRNWRWLTKEQKVFMNVEGEEVGTKLDENPDKQIHQSFINDSYWLLFPFQLMWTEGYDYEVNKNVPSPIHENELTELVINFKDEGGYTPGDTYKLYVTDDYTIKEWSFHPQGSKEPRMINLWNNYENFNGIKLSTDRPNSDGSFRIYFTKIAFK